MGSNSRRAVAPGASGSPPGCGRSTSPIGRRHGSQALLAGGPPARQDAATRASYTSAGVSWPRRTGELRLFSPQANVEHRDPGRDGRCRPPPGQIRTCALAHPAPPSGQTAPKGRRSRVARVTPKRGRSVPPVPGFASFPSGPALRSVDSAEGLTPHCSPPSSLL